MSKVWKLLIVINLAVTVYILLIFYIDRRFTYIYKEVDDLKTLVSKQNDKIFELHDSYEELDLKYRFLQGVLENIDMDLNSGNYPDEESYSYESEEDTDAGHFIPPRVYRRYLKEDCNLHKYEAASLWGSGFGELIPLFCEKRK